MPAEVDAVTESAATEGGLLGELDLIADEPCE